MTFDIEAGGQRHRVDVRRDGNGWVVVVDGREMTADVARTASGFSLLIGSGSTANAPGRGAVTRSYEIAIGGRDLDLVVHVDGVRVPVTVADPRRAWTRVGRDHGPGGAGPRQIVAPMPGRIVKVLVKPGDVVAARQGLVVVEAMKMENELRSPKDGTVAEVRVSEGTSVDANAVLVVVE